VVEYVETGLDPESHQLTIPLQALIAALSDTLRGGRPALLHPRQRGKGAPKDQSFSLVQGVLAGALDVLVRAGMPRDMAADFVANQANLRGVHDRKGQRVAAKQVIAWRARAGDDLAAAGYAVFKTFASHNVADQDTAKDFVLGQLLAVENAGFGQDRNPDKGRLIRK
jgi:hypothetical protein